MYGSIAGTVNDPSGAALPGVTVTATSVERKTVHTAVTNGDGFYLDRAAAPRHLRGQGGARRLQGGGGLGGPGQRRHPDQGRLRARARPAHRGGDRHRRRGPAPEDRPRGRGHDLRRAAGHRAADPRPQLHQAHPAHPRHPAAELGPRGQREPAGLDADGGERADLQRHRLPARRHRQPRPHPRHHRHQPQPGGDRRDQDHLPELRRRVRAGHRRRGLRADEVGHQRVPRQPLRVPADATGSRPATRSPSRTARTRITGPRAARDQARPVRRLDRRPHHRRTSSSSSPTTRARAPPSRRLAAPHRAHGGRAHRRPERVRREHLRSRGRRARVAAAVRRQRHPRQPAVAAGAARSSSSSRCPTRRDRNGPRDNFIAQGSETVQRGQRRHPPGRPAQRHA